MIPFRGLAPAGGSAAALLVGCAGELRRLRNSQPGPSEAEEGGGRPHRRTDVPVVTALRPSALFFSFFYSPERAATYLRPSVKKDMQGGRELCKRPFQRETVEE